jgi:benzoate 4-monooxygenase
MALVSNQLDWNPLHVALVGLGAVVLAHLIPYWIDPHDLRRFPGPFFAKFTDLYLGVVAKSGHRSEIIHELHQKYGA